MTTAIFIPVDPRTGSPLITSEMKFACIGEFTVSITHTCLSCYIYAEESHDGRGNPACCDCHGNVTYEHKHDIPWDTLKSIYKMMANAAAAGLTPSIHPPAFEFGFDPGGEGDKTALAVMRDGQLATYVIKPGEDQAEVKPITFNGNVEYCPVCPFTTSLLEVEQEDIWQVLKCPQCGYRRPL